MPIPDGWDMNVPHPHMTVQQCWDLMLGQLEKKRPNPEKKIPEFQLLEMRRIFFSGFSACFWMMTNLPETGISDEEQCAMLSKRDKEIQGFFARMGEGT